VSQLAKTVKTNQSEAELRGLKENYSPTVKSDSNHQGAFFWEFDPNTETGRQTKAWTRPTRPRMSGRQVDFFQKCSISRVVVQAFQ